MKILTFNIWDTPMWLSVKRKERIARLGAYLKKHDPDIICLQESFDTKHREIVHKAIGKKKYFTSDVNDLMRKVLLFFRMDTTGGLVTFSKFPIKRSVFHPFRRLLLMSPQEWIGRKGFLETEVETPEGPLLVISTHLYSIQSIHGETVRTTQIKQILEKTKAKRKRMASILTGDLNQNKIMEVEPFGKIFKEEGFRDSSELAGKEALPSYRPENPFTHTRFNNGPHPMRLDYVLLSNLGKLGIGVTSNDVLQQPRSPLSDHDPVMVTLK
ncbi:MAG: endonuclease/exonuclease/phosphatase family protein [bacterium]|nr:endonuclease/exonuclease/phosphatase family protein [bacterium]